MQALDGCFPALPVGSCSDTRLSCFRIPEPFDHRDFVFEPKLDGFRALANVRGHHCDLVSRNGHVFKKSGRSSRRKLRTRSGLIQQLWTGRSAASILTADRCCATSELDILGYLASWAGDKRDRGFSERERRVGNEINQLEEVVNGGTGPTLPSRVL
jgi:hypothetical protein